MSDGEIVVKLSIDDGGYKVAVVNAGSLMKEFKRSLDSTSTSIRRVEQDQLSLGKRFRDLVVTMGALRFIAMDVNDIFLRLPMSILKTAGELERMQVLMKGLSKELTEAGRAAEGLRDFQFVTNMAKGAPFEIAALSDSFVKFKVAGIDPTNGSMSALVDSVSRFGGTSESLKRASIAIQQMSGKSVISMEELRQQLGEAVPTAMQDMADGMGVSMKKLTKMVESGTLEAGPAITKMLIQMRLNNEGAAAEMMNTWTGMSSRLKTEWSLAAKSISDAGFGDEAKKAIQEIITLLQSDEFKRFGVQFGNVLGTIIRDVTDVVKFIAQYRDEIGMLIKAWLAYKAVTSVLAPISKSLEGSSRSIGEALKGEVRGVQAKMLADRIATGEAIANKRAEAVAERARSADIITARKTETALIQAENARILANHNRLQAALKASELKGQPGVTMKGVKGAQSKNSVREQIQDMALEMNANRAAIRANADEIRNHERVMQTATIATANQVVATKSMERALVLKTVAARAATLAAGGLSTAIGLLGGPIGLAITAITALVWWYNEAAGAAERSAERQKRANSGVADAKDKADIDTDLAKAERQLADAMARGKNRFTLSDSGIDGAMTQRAKTLAESQADAEAIGAASRRVQDARKAAANAGISVMQASVRDEVNAINWAHETRVREITTASNIERLKVNSEAEKRLSGLKKGSDEYQKEANKINKEKTDLMVSAIKQRLKAEVDGENAAGAALLSAKTEKDRATQTAVMEARKAAREQTEKELDYVQNGLASTVGSGSEKKDKKSPNLGDKDTPLQRLIESISAERKRLEAELDNFNEVEGKGDKAAGIIAKLMDKWEKNEFKDPKTGKNPLKSVMEAIASDAAANQRMKEEQKKREELAQKAREFADFVQGMEPEYLDAVEVLMDPLGKVKMGRSEKRVEKMLGSMTPEELQAAAQRMGTTIDRVREELTNKAQTIDTVSFFQNVEEETKQINASLVDDSREAAIARMTADNQRHAQEMKNLYDKRQASGQASGEELLQLQRIVDASLEARAARLANESRSPIQKIASEWANTTKNMQEATGRWADSAVDSLTQMAATGKLNFRDMAISILADLAKIQVKAALAPWLNVAANFAMGLIGGTGAGAGATNYSLTSASNYSPGAGLGLNPGAFKFADGGIMTEFGSVPLRKYANGGIANSPQMALYGEGKTPEAYVPLPDGRSIPVTLKGLQGGTQGSEGGDNVQINITVNEGSGESSTTSTGQKADVYQQMGERIKSVVREELLSQKRPGGVLYR